MTWTNVPISLLDGNQVLKPIIAYNDGTNSSFAHSILDNTGAIIAPATSTLQSTANTTLSTIATAVQSAIPAGTNSIGTVVVPAAPIPSINVSSTYAHTSVTTAYAFGQLWANNTVAGSVTFPTIQVAKAVNQAFSFDGGLLKLSGTVNTNAVFRIHFFNATPTTAVADYGTFAGNITMDNWVGSMDFTIYSAGSDKCIGMGVPTFGTRISSTPISGSQNLYWIPEVRGAFTPTSAETLTLTINTI